MARGAPFTTDWLGTSPLHLAAQHGHMETCKVLLRAGCSKDARTKVDKTPLHIAAQEGHDNVCDLLLRNGGEIDARDLLQMTPLHWAVEKGFVAVIEILLKFGACTEVESKFDKTPEDIADDNQRPDLAHLLQNAHKYQEFRSEPIDDGLNLDLKPSLPEEKVLGLELDPVQIALSTANVIQPVNSLHKDEGGGNDLSFSTTNGLEHVLNEINNIQSGSQHDEALKLLEAHGITMLPDEDDAGANTSLALTEAGRLALSGLNNSSSDLSTTDNVIAGSPLSSSDSDLLSPLSFTTATPAPAVSLAQKQIDASQLVIKGSTLDTSSTAVENSSSSGDRFVTLRSRTTSMPSTVVGRVTLTNPLLAGNRIRTSQTSLGGINKVSLGNSTLGVVSRPSFSSLTSRPAVQSPLNTFRSLSSNKSNNTLTLTKSTTLSNNAIAKVLNSWHSPVISPPKPEPVVSSPIPSLNKIPRMIRLTPEQFAAFKSSKAGKVTMVPSRRENPIPSQLSKRQKMDAIEELKRKREGALLEAKKFRLRAAEREEEAARLQVQIEESEQSLRRQYVLSGSRHHNVYL